MARKTVVKNPVQEVFDNFIKEMKGVAEKVTMDDSTLPATTKTACTIKMIGDAGVNYDMDGNECATMPNFQVDCYATGQKSLMKVYDISTMGRVAMVNMGFKCDYMSEPQVTGTTKRIIMRFHKIYT